LQTTGQTFDKINHHHLTFYTRGPDELAADQDNFARRLVWLSIAADRGRELARLPATHIQSQFSGERPAAGQPARFERYRLLREYSP
jgi:hypothetical protein